MQHSEHVASGGYPSGAVLVPAGTLLPFGRTTPLGTTPHNPPTPAIGYSPCPEPCAPTPAPAPLDCTGLHRTAPHRSTTKTPHPAGPSWQSRVSLSPHTRTQLVHLTDSSKSPQGCVPPALFGGSRPRWVSVLTSFTFGEWQAARGVTVGVKVSLETGRGCRTAPHCVRCPSSPASTDLIWVVLLLVRVVLAVLRLLTVLSPCGLRDPRGGESHSRKTQQLQAACGGGCVSVLGSVWLSTCVPHVESTCSPRHSRGSGKGRLDIPSRGAGGNRLPIGRQRR